jgi:hypothetical protein
VAVVGSGAIAVLLNQGVDGELTWLGFAAPGSFPAAGITTLATGDIDANGAADVIALRATADGRVRLLLNDGAANFSDVVPHPVCGPGPEAVLPVDLDADGYLDLVVSNHTEGTISVLHNLRASLTSWLRFAPPQPFPVGIGPRGIVATSLAGGDLPDLAVACSLGDMVMLLTNASLAPTAADCNANGVIDACDLLGDYNGDGLVNGADAVIFVDVLLNASAECDALGDMNADGVTDAEDIQLFVNALAP